MSALEIACRVLEAERQLCAEALFTLGNIAVAGAITTNASEEISALRLSKGDFSRELTVVDTASGGSWVRDFVFIMVAF